MREQPKDDARVLNWMDRKDFSWSAHRLYGSTHINMNVSQLVYESWDEKGALREKCVCLHAAWWADFE